MESASAFTILAQENERLQRENRQLREQLDQVRTLARNFLELTHLGGVASVPSGSNSHSSAALVEKKDMPHPSGDGAGSTESKERSREEKERERERESLTRRNSFRLQPIFENDKVVSVVAVHVPEKKRKGKKHDKAASQSQQSSTTAASTTTPSSPSQPSKASRTGTSSLGNVTPTPSSGSNSLDQSGAPIAISAAPSSSGTTTPNALPSHHSFSSPYSSEAPMPVSNPASLTTSSALIASPAAQEFRNIEKVGS
jgi:hypothetical protein